MPLELQIIRAREFVRLGVEEHLDLPASREILRQLASVCRKRGIHQALLDLRDVQPAPTPMLTPDNLASLVNTFCEVGFTDQQRLALLYSADPHYGARMFAFISTLRGWKVRAFDDFEAALHWLSEEPGEKKAGEEEIPLHFKREADKQPTRIQVSEEPDKEK